MINFIQPGNIIEITAPSGGTTSGEPVQVGQILGIAAKTVLATVAVNIQRTGVFDVTKVSAQAWEEGEEIYWDAAAVKMTSVKGGLFAGVAVEAAANPSSTGKLLLVPSGSEGAWHFGTDAVPIVDDTVNRAFLSGYFDSGAVASDSKGLAITLNATGVLQTYSTALYGKCAPSVQVRNPVGVQGDLIFGAAGWIQGLGYAIGGYLQLPGVTVASTGNVACISADIAVSAGGDYSGPTRVSCVRIGVGGDGTALATFETKATFFSFVGFTATGGVTKMLSSTSLNELPSSTIGLRIGIGPGGGGDTMYYIPAVLASEWN